MKGLCYIVLLYIIFISFVTMLTHVESDFLSLQSISLAKKKIVHYTTLHPQKRANAAFLIASYAVSHAYESLLGAFGLTSFSRSGCGGWAWRTHCGRMRASFEWYSNFITHWNEDEVFNDVWFCVLV